MDEQLEPQLGRLVLDDEEQLVVLRRVAERVLRACRQGVVRTVEGQDLAIEFDSICLHSDTPGALDLVEATRKALDTAGIVVRAPR